MPTKQFLSSACKCGKKHLWTLFAVVALASFSFGQTIPGTLKGVATTTHPVTCETETITNYVWTFTDSSGGQHAFTGHSDVEILWVWLAAFKECAEDNVTGSLDEWSTDGLYYLAATGASGSVTLGPGTSTPKFIVIGVTYAPPGHASTVQLPRTVRHSAPPRQSAAPSPAISARASRLRERPGTARFRKDSSASTQECVSRAR